MNILISVILLLSTSFLISGCFESNPPIIKTEDRIVKVEVKVPCKTKQIDKPVLPVDSLKKEDPLFNKVQSALAELEIREGYEKKLEAAIKECQ